MLFSSFSISCFILSMITDLSSSQKLHVDKFHKFAAGACDEDSQFKITSLYIWGGC